MNSHTVKKIGRHSVTLSHLDHLWFKKPDLTKGDIITYYQKIAPLFIAHAKNHLIVLHRFPEGVDHEGFFQKQISDYFPAWLSHATIALKKGGEQTLACVKTAADLLYLVNQGTLTFHSWLSDPKKPDYPTKIVFDLDPSKGKPLAQLRAGALYLKAMFEDVGLVPFIMTTGSRGYHIVAPIQPTHHFDMIHTWAHAQARTMVEKHPKHFTIESSIAARGNKIFVDYLRNGYGQTSVTPYSVRAVSGAPIATPIEWDELSHVKPQSFTVKNIDERLDERDDPWMLFKKSARTLKIKR